MLRDTSKDLTIHLRDRLRDIRDFMRAHRHDQYDQLDRERHRPDLEGLLGRAVSVVDDTLTLAETASRTARPGNTQDQLVLLPLTDYFNANGENGERAFRKHMYPIARRVAARRKSAASHLLRETTFTQAHETIRLRQGHILFRLRRATGPHALRPLFAGLLAELLQELCRHALNEPAPSPAKQSLEDAVAIFAPGLVASALSDLDASLEPAELLETAVMAVAARCGRMARSLEADQPIEDLTAVFASLLEHLP
ncbi:hypothetical protein AB2N04_03775 [Nitratireductor sp. GISD-1A_MAKvit]|uniref:hypothetical protein n=1 Tax=Nitratireductor sp. GISD-1A_MAKvit TaxID=3234198 RepID=UPI0034659FAD